MATPKKKQHGMLSFINCHSTMFVAESLWQHFQMPMPDGPAIEFGYCGGCIGCVMKLGLLGVDGALYACDLLAPNRIV